MMTFPLVEYYKPRKLSPGRLDKLLAGGWFRSSNSLFRNKILCISGQICSVLNIRLDLKSHEHKKRMRKLINKNSNFRVEKGPLEICEQFKHLYHLTSQRFKGFVFPNIYNFLYDNQDRGIFSSYHIKVYDGDKLIAASVFDMGNTSMMSVLGLYDPEYTRHSLGIFTMLCELEYGKSLNKRWYYPGYVLEEYDLFDYKLSIGNFQYLQATQRWKYDKADVVKESPVPILYEGSHNLEVSLKQSGLPYKRLLYKLFSLGYAYPKGTFVREPIIFILPELSQNPHKISIAAFDEESRKFTLRHPMMIQETFLSVTQTEEYQDLETYYDQILQDSEEDCLYFSNASSLIKKVKELILSKEEGISFFDLHLLK